MNNTNFTNFIPTAILLPCFCSCSVCDRQLGLKLPNIVMTLENLANTLLEPKCDGLCAELHTCLLTNINAAMSRKYPWYIGLF
ncbi:unnamed protein product [Peronospora belbahrii]|uniref:Saposin B-type domain-containing protein n=1 Tax=Peronospora belbahrii TaxID=622444 RepID=A0AAU9L6W4_9STRA|nr:unnamed protein product [Peronospora belbahrii]